MFFLEMTAQTPANAEIKKWLQIRVRFFTNFDSMSGSGPKEKRRILPESTPALWIRCHLWLVWRRNEQCFQRFHRARFRDDHYPVCRLGIRQGSDRVCNRIRISKNCFQTGTEYGSWYPKRFYRYFEDSDFWKQLHIAQSLIYYLQKHLFSFLCHDSESLCGIISEP